MGKRNSPVSHHCLRKHEQRAGNVTMAICKVDSDRERERQRESPPLSHHCQ